MDYSLLFYSITLSGAALAIMSFAHAGVLDFGSRQPNLIREFHYGVVFGSVAFVTMNLPLAPAYSPFIDIHTTPMLLAAMFGGPVAALIAATPLVVALSWTPGTEGEIDLTPFVTAVSLGLISALVIRSRKPAPGPPELTMPEVWWRDIVGLAAMVAIVGLAAPMVTQPHQAPARFMTIDAILRALTAPTAILAFGGVLLLNLRRHRSLLRTTLTDRAMATLVANTPGVFFRRRRAADGTVTYPLLLGRVSDLLGPLTDEDSTMPEPIFAAAHPDDRHRLAEAFETSRHLRSPIDIDARILRPDSASPYWLHIAATLVDGRDAKGATLWDGFVTDITRRKHTEMALADARAQLETLAGTDALTGLANRRGFEEAIAREWRLAKREGTSLSVVILDVDHFKAYNDLLGHAAGDACLRVVSGVLAAAGRRPKDIAARIGGEEFALLLPRTGLTDAALIAEAVRARIGPEGRARAQDGQVTVSLGVAEAWPGRDGETSQAPDALMASADAALYEAKRAGRNCVRLGPARVEGATFGAETCGGANIPDLSGPDRRTP